MTVLRWMVSRKWIITTLVVIIGAAICARLGIWQLDRLVQKRAFNAHYQSTIALPTLKITSAPEIDLAEMEYRSVAVSGVYDFEHQIALRNQVYDNQPGYHLLTPLVLSDGTGILVERGWVPSQGNDQPSGWRAYDQPGEVTVRGILRLGQTESQLGGVSDPALAPGQTRLDVWNQVNVARIAQQLPYRLLPAFVQPNLDASVTQPPYPYQPEIVIDEGPHEGYALQWFAFAALLFFGYPLFYLPYQMKAEKK